MAHLCAALPGVELMRGKAEHPPPPQDNERLVGILCGKEPLSWEALRAAILLSRVASGREAPWVSYKL